MKEKKMMVACSLLTAVSLLSACGERSVSVFNLSPNVKTTFVSQVKMPVIPTGSFVHPQASVIGNIEIGQKDFVAPFASIRGDEGQPIHIGNETNVQDGVVIHGLETESNGKPVEKNRVTVNGKAYSVYIGDRVSVAHQAQVHGPAFIGNDVFVGMQAFVFKARVGNHVVIEPTAKVIGVTIPDGRYVPAGTVLTKQEEADKLPVIDDNYVFAKLNEGVLDVNIQLAEGYIKASELKK